MRGGHRVRLHTHWAMVYHMLVVLVQFDESVEGLTLLFVRCTGLVLEGSKTNDWCHVEELSMKFMGGKVGIEGGRR